MKKSLTCLAIITLLAGCGGGSSDNVVVPDPVIPPVNNAPSANAGNEQTAIQYQTVSLSADNSSDPDGDTLTYAWEIDSKPTDSTVELTKTAISNISFTPDLAGEYSFSLTVNDGNIDSPVDTVTITVEKANTIPVAEVSIQANGIYTLGQEAVIYGNFSDDDDDNDSVFYTWILISQPANSDLSDVVSDKSYLAFAPDTAGDYVAQLIVNDGTDDSLPVTVSVTVNERDELTSRVKLESIYTATIGEELSIDFSDTLSISGEPLTFSHSLLTETSTPIISTSLSEPSKIGFTALDAGWHRIAVSVTENDQTSEERDIAIVASSADDNEPPNHGGVVYLYGMTGELVTIDASQYITDVNVGDIHYEWNVSIQPAFMPEIIFDDVTSATQSFSFEIPGTYAFNISLRTDESSIVANKGIYLVVADKHMPVVANAGADELNTLIGEELLLTGANSLNLDDVDEIKWSVTSAPDNSNAAINEFDQTNASFIPDVQGRYVVQLSLIIDEKLYSGDTKVIEVEDR